MTPTDFEDRAREACKKFCSDVPYGEWDNPYEICFDAGAKWSRRETIAEILGMMREYVCGKELANNIERELQKDAPKAKEGCYSDYQNG